MTTPRPTPRLPSSARMTAMAFAQLAAFTLVLKSRGFSAMRAWLIAYPVATRRSDAGTLAVVTRAVDRACMYSPVSMRCLARAAIATRLLRAHGLPATLVIGVHRMPFSAHAWVELGGEPVYGLPDRYTWHQVIDRL